MGFPVLSDSVVRTGSATSSFAAQLMASVDPGDRLIAVVEWNRAAGTCTLNSPPSGWVSVGASGTGANTAVWEVFMLTGDAVGDEDGTSPTWGFSATTDPTVTYLRYQAGTFDTNVDYLVGGASNSVNPSALTAPWGMYDVAWATLLASTGTVTAITEPTTPGTWAGLVETGQITGGSGRANYRGGITFLDLVAASNNPNTWTATGATSSRSATAALLGFSEGVRARVPIAGNPTTGPSNMVIPSYVAAGDLMLVAVTSRNHTSGDALVTCVDDEGGDTWTLEHNTTDRKAYLFSKVASASSAGKTITVDGAINSLSGGLVVCYGVSGVSGLTEETNASGDESHAGITVGADSLVGFVIFNTTNDLAISSGSGATIGSLGTEQLNALSNGGSDCGVGFYVKQATGATGTLTWSQTNAATYSFAFEMPLGGGQTLTGSLFSKSPSFPQGSITLDDQFLTGVLFSNPPSFLVGELTTNAQTLSGILFSRPPSFPQGSITQIGPDQTLNGVLFSNPPDFTPGGNTHGVLALHSPGNHAVFTGVSTDSGTGAVDPGPPDVFPSGGGPSITGDLWLLQIESEGEDTNPAAPPSGGAWTLLDTAASHTDSSAASTRITIYWLFYDSDDPPNTTVPDTGDHTRAAITSWRDVNPTDPFNVVYTETEPTATESHTIGATTTTQDDCLIIIGSTRGEPAHAADISNTVFGGVIPNAFSSVGTGGSGGANAQSYFRLVTAGGTGTNTYSTTPISTESASIVLALNPLVTQGFLVGMLFSVPPTFFVGVITGGSGGGGGGELIGGWGIPIGIT